jgi:hypothetical protein
MYTSLQAIRTNHLELFDILLQWRNVWLPAKYSWMNFQVKRIISTHTYFACHKRTLCLKYIITHWYHLLNVPMTSHHIKTNYGEDSTKQTQQHCSACYSSWMPISQKYMALKHQQFLQQSQKPMLLFSLSILQDQDIASMKHIFNTIAEKIQQWYHI